MARGVESNVCGRARILIFREFRDVVFEDVFDNNSFVTIYYRRISYYFW